MMVRIIAGHLGLGVRKLCPALSRRSTHWDDSSGPPWLKIQLVSQKLLVTQQFVEGNEGKYLQYELEAGEEIQNKPA